jgi:hypothetical protein
MRVCYHPRRRAARTPGKAAGLFQRRSAETSRLQKCGRGAGRVPTGKGSVLAEPGRAGATGKGSVLAEPGRAGATGKAAVLADAGLGGCNEGPVSMDSLVDRGERGQAWFAIKHGDNIFSSHNCLP